MSPEALAYTKALHIFGQLMWVAGLFAVYQSFFGAGKADDSGRRALLDHGRKMAIAMDIGALLTIGGGLGLLFGIGAAQYMKLPWMHVKLTLVVLLLGTHVYARIKLGKLRRGGDTSTPPEALFALLNLILVGLLIMAIVKPFT